VATCRDRPRHLTLAAAQTLRTQASTGRARCLGYAIGTMNSQTQCDKARQRVGSAQMGFSIPEDIVETKRTRYLRDGQAQHRAELMHESAYAIITR
jgi:hypothetical protein